MADVEIRIANNGDIQIGSDRFSDILSQIHETLARIDELLGLLHEGKPHNSQTAQKGE